MSSVRHSPAAMTVLMPSFLLSNICLEPFLLLIRILKIALRRGNLNEKAQEKIFAITVGNHVYIRYDSCKFNPLAFVALIPQVIRKFQGAESRLANTKFSYLNHIVTSVRRGKRQTMRT